jgi:putative acetyltransferase
MGVSIEPVAPAHFEGLWRALDVVAREKRYLAFTEAPAWESSRAFYEHIVANDLCQVVAVLDDEVVGWCDILPGVGQTRAHVGTLGIGLVPAARHQGIGARLMRAAIDGAWARGLTRIELSVRADNANAQALYKRLGFEPEGVRRHSVRVDGQYHDSLAMALLRDEGA